MAYRHEMWPIDIRAYMKEINDAKVTAMCEAKAKAMASIVARIELDSVIFRPQKSFCRNKTNIRSFSLP